jgi:hypothetical protein
MEQTAVEWLEEQTRKPEWHSLKRQDIFEQAKEMEKQQIINACIDGKENKKTIKLTLKKQWFDMIEAGIKTEEYREIKPYWIERLCNEFGFISYLGTGFKKFDFIQFTNGYNPKSPKIIVECKGIEIGCGKTEWGAIENENYFIIKLGKVIDKKNIKQQ